MACRTTPQVSFLCFFLYSGWSSGRHAPHVGIRSHTVPLCREAFGFILFAFACLLPACLLPALISLEEVLAIASAASRRHPGILWGIIRLPSLFL